MRQALLATLIAAVLLAPAPAGAQGNPRPRVEIELPPLETVTTQGPLVHARSMLSEQRVREALRNGFPVRLNFRVELWSTEGWFNSLVSRTEWEIVVRRDGLEETYFVNWVFAEDRKQEGPFPTVTEAEAAVAEGIRVSLTPPRRRERYYYNVVCEMELLSVSDLDELERWLRGEAGPAVRGERNPGTALTRGLRTLFVRLLGGDGNRYEARTVTFFVS